MKFYGPINNFTSGEWSPKMRARTDTDQYAKACESMQNFITQIQGGAAYRGGTRFYSLSEALSATTIRDNLDDCINSSDVNFSRDYNFQMITYRRLHEIDVVLLLVTGTNADDKAYYFSIGVGGSQIQECTLGTEMGAGIIQDLEGFWNYTQIGDILFMTHTSGGFKPRVFYYDGANYTLENLDTDYFPQATAWKATPYGDIEAFDTSVTLTINTASVGTGRTLTASAAYFTADMVGCYFKMGKDTDIIGVCVVTAFTDSTNVTVTVIQAISDTSAFGGSSRPTTFWQKSTWEIGSYPRTVTAFQSRLIFGGSPNNPDTIWGSRISNVFDFDEVPSPDDPSFIDNAFVADNSRPFTLSPASGEISDIVAMSSAKTLLINTSGNEITAYGSNGALGPNNVVFESSTSFGAVPVQPARVNNYVTFVQKTGYKLRDMIFSFQEDQFKSTDLGFVADHLFAGSSFTPEFGSSPKNNIMELCSVSDATSVLYARTANRTLCGVTLDRDYQVNAWFPIVLGKEVNDTDPRTTLGGGSVHAMCSVNVDYQGQCLLLLTSRTVDGDVKMFVEQLYQPWDEENETYSGSLGSDLDKNYLDCAVFFPITTGATSWNLGSYFANATVDYITNGTYVGTLTANGSGVVTTPAAVDRPIFGFRYTGILKTMPIEQGGQLGVPMARIKRIDELNIRFLNTYGASYGRDADTQYPIEFRSALSISSDPVEFFTGDKTVDFPAGYDGQAQVCIIQAYPYPCHVLAVIPRGVTYD